MPDKLNSVVFTCDVNAVPDLFPHFWEHTVGSDHATMALRADWQRQLSRCRKELGFKHVRFHGILCDDMGTLVKKNGLLIYSFFNADQIIDFLLSIDMRPFVELSFMPAALSSGNTTVFHYAGNVTPPKSYEAWETVVYKLVDHWVKRYGLVEVSKWFFEVWNEPNLEAFWTGTQADYFKLYTHTANAIKSVHPDLKVGGPATAKNAWITDFLNFCEKNNLPADFISTHHYPTDSFGKPGDDTLTQLAKSKRSILREQAIETKNKSKGKPVYYTEWNTSSNPFDALHDLPYASAYIMKTVMEAQGLVEGYSYWTFSDIFEENYFSSLPYHGGFGLLNIYGIPKPAYRAFELLHRMGDKALPVVAKHPTVDVWVVTNQDVINILIVNSALPRHEIKEEIVRVELNSIKNIKNSFAERIDETHANPRQEWIEMGSPDSLSYEQVQSLEKSSALIKKPLNIISDDDEISITIVVPPQGIAFITLEKR